MTLVSPIWSWKESVDYRLHKVPVSSSLILQQREQLNKDNPTPFCTFAEEAVVFKASNALGTNPYRRSLPLE